MIKRKQEEALVAIALSMKEHKESSRADEADESQSLGKDESSTSDSNYEDFEKYLDQQTKR